VSTADLALSWIEKAVPIGFYNERYLGQVDPGCPSFAELPGSNPCWWAHVGGKRSSG